MANGRIVARAERFGYYQVFASVNNPEIRLGHVYMAPNPLRGEDIARGQKATITVEVPKVDLISYRIYNVKGDLITEGEITGDPDVINGKSVYRKELDPNIFSSGVYLGRVTVNKANRDTKRNTNNFKFTVIK
jgi:hypothetical protein